MAMAGMTQLKSLQTRCDRRKHSNSGIMDFDECIMRPEAMIVLMNSKSLERLTLENIGLLDDHIDALADEITNLQQSSSSLRILGEGNLQDVHDVHVATMIMIVILTVTTTLRQLLSMNR
jgi:hypothetical protein